MIRRKDSELRPTKPGRKVSLVDDWEDVLQGTRRPATLGGHYCFRFRKNLLEGALGQDFPICGHCGNSLKGSEERSRGIQFRASDIVD